MCDGFVGNIALRICEGLAMKIVRFLRNSYKRSLRSQLGYMSSRGTFKGINRTMDYSQSGGAPLLRVRGVCVISHGMSTANALKNAIRVAAGLVRARVNEKIKRGLSLTHAMA